MTFRNCLALAVLALSLLAPAAVAVADQITQFCMAPGQASQRALARAQCDATAESLAYTHGVVRPCGGPDDVCVVCPAPEKAYVCEGVGRSQCHDTTRNYISTDPAECVNIRWLCPEGSVAFSDQCGCGCQTAP